ncbi:hypothetical protein VNO77_01286 [Canavalia gladiata]|uniref:Uncharacterized protein n=1 Tax=Canavalia gladiata TaxID=3824 RepID=A0AAN9R548_CANGL
MTSLFSAKLAGSSAKNYFARYSSSQLIPRDFFLSYLEGKRRYTLKFQQILIFIDTIDNFKLTIAVQIRVVGSSQIQQAADIQSQRQR